jgi:MtrB/PioB family decaheme-associated outer membrane protein
MTTHVLSFRAQRTLIALAACAVCMSVSAQPVTEGTVRIGLGAFDGSGPNRALFNQYTGAHASDDVAVSLGVDYSLRDEDAGKWVDFNGSNLFGETREINVVAKIPGVSKVVANYGELLRVDPNVLNTTLVGVGTANPRLVSPPALPGAGVDHELQTKRTSMGLGLTQIISPSLQLQVSFKSEQKEGNKAFSLAYTCPVAQGSICNTMVPEPINSTHTQFEARATYSLDKLHVNAGYYGSFYDNSNTALNVAGLPASPFNQVPVALSPKNQAHQFDVSGNYDFSNTTHGNFKLAWATASQNANFADAGLTGPAIPGGTVSSSGARVDTILAKVGFTSRPLAKLTLSGDVRYENKDDQTPLFNYNLISPSTGTSTNHLLPNTKVLGKLQAGWQFDSNFRGTVGADFESIDRATYTSSSILTGINAWRQDTRETTLHADLRRQLTSNVSGTVGLSTSRREGSNWLQPVGGSTGVVDMATPATSALFMSTQADRQRDKVKISADWQPNEKLNLQFVLENGTDSYTAPTNNGLRDTSMNLVDVDWTYALNDKWGVNGSLSQGKQSLKQAYYAGTVMSFDNTNWGVSVGLSGKPTATVQVGANLSYLDDKSAYAQSADATAPASVATRLATAGGLPDVNFRQTALKLYASYALQNKSLVRLDLVHQRTSSNDWAWGYNGLPVTYSDGATVSQQPDQNVSFVGVTYIYPLK